jgi:hypothetical protein
MPPTTMSSGRAGFVEFQQRLARVALERGELGAARAALRVLRSRDFVGGADTCEAYFNVLREPGASDAELRDAIAAIVRLRPAGGERSISHRGD